jgi:hypothetical protein
MSCPESDSDQNIEVLIAHTSSSASALACRSSGFT